MRLDIRKIDNREPDVSAQEILDDLEAALEQFRLIANDLEKKEMYRESFSIALPPLLVR